MSAGSAPPWRLLLCVLLCVQAQNKSNDTEDVLNDTTTTTEAPTEACEDVPGWNDGTGEMHGCSDYVGSGWCTSAGEHGPNWGSDSGFIQMRRGVRDLHAFDACCGCGGGQVPHDGRVIHATFVTQGVDFAGLMANETMVMAFKGAIEQSIRKVGQLFSDASVSVRLRNVASGAGRRLTEDVSGVQSQATIMTSQPTSDVLNLLHSNATALTNEITDYLWVSADIRSVSDGVIRTQAVSIEADFPMVPEQERCRSLQTEIQRQGCDFPTLFDDGYTACVDLENADGIAYWEIIEAKEASCYKCSGFNLRGCVCTTTCQEHGGRWCDPPHRDPYCAANCRERVTISAGHLRWLEIKGVKARTCDTMPGLCPSR